MRYLFYYFLLLRYGLLFSKLQKKIEVLKDACTELAVYENYLMLEDPTNPRFGDSFKQLFGTEPEGVNWNDEAIQERLKTLPKFSLRFQVLTADCLDPSKSFQKLVKKPYSAIVIDTIYEFDHGPSSEDLALIDADQEQPTTVDDLQKMLNAFKDLTTDN